MPLDQHPLSPHPETTTSDDASAPTLRAEFIADERAFTGAHCELPGGEVVEVRHRRTPLYDLARELEKRGYGDCRIEISTPTGTPSMRGKVSTLAGLSIEESDKDGLRLRAYRPIPPGRVAKERDLGPEGTRTPENEKMRVSESTAGVEAA